MHVGSLFTGIGGFDLGFERAGMSVAWQCEIEPFARAVLQKHWPHVALYDDVRSIRGDAVEPIEVLCGGFPCQDISVAGKGAGIDGERSGLWREYARLVRECRPRWVVAENVPALRTRGYDRVADDLEAAGYAVWPFVVGADDVGAPHRRKRVWIVAHAKELGSPLGRAGALSGRAVAERSAVESERCRRADDAAHASEAGREGLRRSLGVSAQVAGHYGDGGGWYKRPPVPAICELDDGIPAGLVRHRRPALAALGNALVPAIAECIGRTILKIEAER